MKKYNHLKTYDLFINESLVTGKFDVSEINKAISTLMDKIVKMKGSIDKVPYLKLFELSPESLKKINEKIKSDIKIGDLSFNFDPELQNPGQYLSYKEQINGKIMYRVMIQFSKEFYNLSSEYRESIIAHEISHVLDPNNYRKDIDEIELKKLGMTSKDYKDLNYEINKYLKKGEKIPKELKYKFLKAYTNKETEREAYVSMITYMVNKLLIKYPERREALNSLLRVGDWRVDKVFPELEDFLDNEKYADNLIFRTYQRYRDKLLKKLATISASNELILGESFSLRILLKDLRENIDIITKNEYNSWTEWEEIVSFTFNEQKPELVSINLGWDILGGFERRLDYAKWAKLHLEFSINLLNTYKELKISIYNEGSNIDPDKSIKGCEEYIKHIEKFEEDIKNRIEKLKLQAYR